MSNGKIPDIDSITYFILAMSEDRETLYHFVGYQEEPDDGDVESFRQEIAIDPYLKIEDDYILLKVGPDDEDQEIVEWLQDIIRECREDFQPVYRN